MLRANDLSKRFGEREVLRQLELSIPAGAVYGLLGRNGGGKTTLLGLLLGLLRPDRGDALVHGTDLRLSPEIKRRVAYVAEAELLPGWATIADLMRLESSARDTWEPAALEAWLAAERLARGRAVQSLSKGQRKRLEVELALAGRPSVFILDEPLSGLDPVARAEILEALMAWVAESGATVIMSSHVLSELERICDRIGVLAGGRIALEASLDELKDGGAVVVRDGRHGEALEGVARVLAYRTSAQSTTWVVTGLAAAARASLVQAGHRVSTGGLEELGVELIRCLDERKE